VKRGDPPPTRRVASRTVVAVPRPPRLQVAGGLYHVTARSNIGRIAFQDDAERAEFLAVLETGVARCGWSCRSYCLLSTHYHLLVATPEPDLSAGMQYVNGRYAQWANWYRSERSHLFEGRFRSVLVETESHALEAHRYIALNPVRAGLVRDPEEWPWSSLGAILGRKHPLGFLDVDTVLAEFGETRATARRRLRTFVRDGLRRDMP
jgi:REP element-mobilizing transposase RayT